MSNKGNITDIEHDPHSSNEEGYDRKTHPGGANPPDDDISPNDAIHDGKQHPRSGNTSSPGPVK